MTPPAPKPQQTPQASLALRSDSLLDLWHHSNDVLYVHDLTGRFTAVNATATHTYGYTEAEMLAMSIRDLVDPTHLAKALAQMQAKATGAQDRSAPYELLTRTKTGDPVWVEVSTRVVHQDGKPVGVQGSARNITARKSAEAIADLVHEASLSLNEAASLEAGVQDAMGRVALAAGWTYAEAWFPDTDGKALVLGPQWSRGDGLEKFTRLARQYRYVPGEGIPGRVWQQGKTLAGPELPPVDDFPRRAAAQAAGLRTYACVPVGHGGRFAAVLLFFGTKPSSDDARWVRAAELVAQQLGAAIGRRLDVERVRSAGRMFAAQFEALDDPLLMLDAEGVPRQANSAFLALCGVQVTSTDAAIPLVDRVDDKARFLGAVASLYEGRGAGREAVEFEGRTLRRTVSPLRSRNGSSLGVLLRIQV
jgi:PAS domain S-box-containing protein